MLKEKAAIDSTIEKYLEIKNTIKQLEEENEQLKIEIIQAMNGKEELVTDFHKITNKEQIRDGIDLKKLKENFPSIYSECFKPSIYNTLRVK
jgi:predicted phage-related endonuclease